MSGEDQLSAAIPAEAKATHYLANHASEETTAEVLFSLCADQNASAWMEFIRRFHPVIAATVVRTARRYTRAHPDLCNDLAQEVYLKFSTHGGRILREFRPRHSVAAFGYVKVIAANAVHDYFKSTHFKHVAEADASPGSLSADQAEWRIRLREIDDLLRRFATRRDRQIFWLYYRQGMTAKEIAAIQAVGLGVKGVESAIERQKNLIRHAFKPERVKASSAVGA